MGNAATPRNVSTTLSEKDKNALLTLQHRFGATGTTSAGMRPVSVCSEQSLGGGNNNHNNKRPPPSSGQVLMRKHSKNNLGGKLPVVQEQVQLVKRTASVKNLVVVSQEGKNGDESTRSRVMSCGEGHIHHTEAEVVTLLAQVITERVLENDAKLAIAAAKNSGKEYGGDIFCGPCTPKITVQDYLERLIHYLTGIARYERDTGHDEDVKSDMAIRYLVMAVIYLDKIHRAAEAKASSFVVCSKNIHRLLITGITVASKIVDDYQPKNSYFAQLGGITVQELNALEREFCSILGYNLTIHAEEFDRYYADILAMNAVAVMGNSSTRQPYEVGRARQGSAAAA